MNWLRTAWRRMCLKTARDGVTYIEEHLARGAEISSDRRWRLRGALIDMQREITRLTA